MTDRSCLRTQSRDGRFVALAARVTLSTLHGMEEVPAPGLPPERGLKVQRPDYEIEVADVLAVASDGAFLLFGATKARRPNAAPDAEPSSPVFVVVSATVIGQDRARRDAIN